MLLAGNRSLTIMTPCMPLAETVQAVQVNIAEKFNLVELSKL